MTLFVHIIPIKSRKLLKCHHSIYTLRKERVIIACIHSGSLVLYHYTIIDLHHDIGRFQSKCREQS